MMAGQQGMQQAQQPGWMEKLFGMGGMSPQQNMLMMGLRMMGNAGGGPGRAGMGFGAGMADAYMGQMGTAQQLEQMAFRRNLEKQRLESQEKYQEQMLKMRESEAKLASDRFISEQQLRAGIAQAQMTQEGELERKRMESRERIAEGNQQAVEAYVNEYIRAFGDSPDIRQLAIRQYNKNQRSGMSEVYDQLLQNPNYKPGDGQVVPDSSVYDPAAVEGDINAGNTPNEPAAKHADDGPPPPPQPISATPPAQTPFTVGGLARMPIDAMRMGLGSVFGQPQPPPVAYGGSAPPDDWIRQRMGLAYR
jgi:hypothetical protein